MADNCSGVSFDMSCDNTGNMVDAGEYLNGAGLPYSGNGDVNQSGLDEFQCNSLATSHFQENSCNSLSKPKPNTNNVMRRYRKSTGKESLRVSRANSRPSLAHKSQMQNAGVAMGMMAASGVRQGGLVQRAQMQTMGQKPRFTSGQVRNAGIALGMMAASGQRSFKKGGHLLSPRDDAGFFGRLRSSFESLKDMALTGDTGSEEFDDIL